jgi:hypothetical protein
MKIRMGFVSNSSSSSFICIAETSFLEDSLDKCFDNLEVKNSFLGDYSITQEEYDSIKEIVKEWITTTFEYKKMFDRSLGLFKWVFCDCDDFSLLPSKYQSFIKQKMNPNLNSRELSNIISSIINQFEVYLRNSSNPNMFIIEDEF